MQITLVIDTSKDDVSKLIENLQKLQSIECSETEEVEKVITTITTRKPDKRYKIPFDDIQNIRKEYAEGKTNGEICRKYGLSSSYVSLVTSGKTRLHY